MNEVLSIRFFEKFGFTPVKTTSKYTLLKSDNGVVIAYNDGEFEGLLKESLKESILDEGTFKTLLGMILIVGLGTTYFTTDITIVSGESMEPTYKSGNVIIKTKTSSAVEKLLVSRNSIIKFKSPDGETMIKRVMAVPGDEIEYKSSDIFVNGKYVGQNNVWAKQRQDKVLSDKNKYNDKLSVLNKPFSFKLKNGEYYVMGDNQNLSIDSRNFGPISSDCVISVIGQ